MEQTIEFLQSKLDAGITEITDAILLELQPLLRADLEEEFKHQWPEAFSSYDANEHLSKSFSRYAADAISLRFNKEYFADEMTIGEYVTAMLVETNDERIDASDKFVTAAMSGSAVTELIEFIESEFDGESAERMSDHLRQTLDEMAQDNMDFTLPSASVELAIVTHHRCFTLDDADREAVLASAYLFGATLNDALILMERMEGGEPGELELDHDDNLDEILDCAMGAYEKANSKCVSRYKDWGAHTTHDGTIDEAWLAEMVDCTAGYYMQPAIVLRVDSKDLFKLKPGDDLTLEGRFVAGVYDCRNGSQYQHELKGRFRFVRETMEAFASHDEEHFGKHTPGKEVESTYGSRSTYTELATNVDLKAALKRVSKPRHQMEFDFAV